MTRVQNLKRKSTTGYRSSQIIQQMTGQNLLDLMVPTVLECPGKSLNFGEFEILSGNVLENIKIINET